MPALVLGDFRERDAGLGRKGFAGHPGLAGQRAAQGDREPAPQLGGAGVEQDRVGVVVAVRAERLAEPGITAGVQLVAGQRATVRARLAFASRTAAQDAAATFSAGVDRAERRRGQGVKTDG